MQCQFIFPQKPGVGLENPVSVQENPVSVHLSEKTRCQFIFPQKPGVGLDGKTQRPWDLTCALQPQCRSAALTPSSSQEQAFVTTPDGSSVPEPSSISVFGLMGGAAMLRTAGVVLRMNFA